MFTINHEITHLTPDLLAESEVVSITPDICLETAATIRWVIVPTGELPIASNAFDALSGEFNFNAGDVAPQTLSLTPNAIKHGFGRDFEIRFYDGETLLTSFSFDIVGDEDVNYHETTETSGADKNVITLGTTSDVATNGVANDDTIIITKYQYGDATITDGAGFNLIAFDAGVEIVGFQEASRFEGRNISAITLTLSTGAEITIQSPKSSSKTYQLGDGTALNYAAFKDVLFASDDDTFATNTAITLTTPITVKTHVPAPVLSDTPVKNVHISSIGGANDDILIAGTDYDLTIDGDEGNDILIITRFQYGDVTINDTLDLNLIKFDAGVEIVGFQEASRFAGRNISAITLTLSTGAEITIANPTLDSLTYQLGNGDVFADYGKFKAALFASDDDNFVPNTDITFTNPIEIALEIAPEFRPETYIAKVNDDIESGGKIIKVQAQDEDTPSYDLSYHIIHGNDEGLFAIDSKSGLITLAMGKSLDFDTVTDNKYTITVEVRGGGGGDEPKASAIIEIMETEAPEFTGAVNANGMSVISEDYLSANIELPENFAAFDTPILTLSAKDEDAEPNEALVFRIIKGNLDNNGDEIFSINTATGAVSVRNDKSKYLDEDTSHMITIRVCDADGLHDDIDIIIEIGAPILADVI